MALEIERPKNTREPANFRRKYITCRGDIQAERAEQLVVQTWFENLKELQNMFKLSLFMRQVNPERALI